MSEMVERAARAAYDFSRRSNAASATPLDLPDWDGLDADVQNLMVECQRFAIATMREPTEAMTGNAKRLMEHPKFTHYDAAFAWRSMIDEALK